MHDVKAAEELTKNVYGSYVTADTGYDSDDFRIFLQANGNTPVVSARKNRKVPIQYDKNIYKYRKLIEIYFGKLKENRRLAMRFDKSDIAFLAFIAIANIKILIC